MMRSFVVVVALTLCAGVVFGGKKKEKLVVVLPSAVSVTLKDRVLGPQVKQAVRRTAVDDTRVLGARFGQYAVEAKQQGDAWFVGAMTNWDAREVELDFSFLPAGKSYYAALYTNGVDASQYEFKKITVNSKSKVRVKLAEGGGAVA